MTILSRGSQQTPFDTDPIRKIMVQAGGAAKHAGGDTAKSTPQHVEIQKQSIMASFAIGFIQKMMFM